MSEARVAFSRRLTAEARHGWVSLYLSDSAQQQGRLLTAVRRNGNRIILATASGFGLTLHRRGGISLPNLPRSGGTSILWGDARDRVRRLGRDHRAIELGPIGIYIGRDF